MAAKSIAVIGAGPSGLVAAKELLQEGHRVACFERAADLGGVFRFPTIQRPLGSGRRVV
jgi:cation diffusion facilitator CzcD-associated flavoprotein CzcO